MNKEIVDITDELHLDATVRLTASNLLGAWELVASDDPKIHFDRGPASAASVLFAALDGGFPVTSNDVQTLSSHNDRVVLMQESQMRTGMNLTLSTPSPGEYAQEYVVRLDSQLEMGLGSDAVDPAVDVAEAGHPYQDIEHWQAGAGAVLKTTDTDIDQMCEVANCGHASILGALTELPKNVD